LSLDLFVMELYGQSRKHFRYGMYHSPPKIYKNF
jgi:hypothetical protein